MRRHDGAQPVDPRLPEQPRHARVGAAPVEEHGTAVGVLDERRVALPHVEERDGEVVRRSRAGDRPRREHDRRQRDQGTRRERPPRGDPSACSGLIHPRPASPHSPCDREPERGQPQVDGADRDRPRQADRGDRMRERGEAGRHQIEPREQRLGRKRDDGRDRVRGVRARRSEGRQLAGGGVQHARPHHRRDGGQRREICRDRHERHRLEVEREQRRGRDARDRGEPQGARGQAARRERPRGDDPRHRRERELPAGVARHARVRRQRYGRREQQRIRSRCRPRSRERDQPGRAHHGRALQRRAGTRKRHVQRDEGEQDRDARPRRDAGEREQRHRQRAQEHHVLAAHREQVGKPRVAPVIACQRVDRLVLPEHHPAQERRLVGRQPIVDRLLGAAAGRIDRSGDPVPAGARRLDLRQMELQRDAAPAQVRRPVEARSSTRSGGFASPRTRTTVPGSSGPAPPLDR